MKVVENLFNSYTSMDYHNYVQKYLAAKALIDLTEVEESETYKQVCEWRDCLHRDCPISLFRAVRFLEGKDTVLTYTIDDVQHRINKNEGDDYRLVEWLGDFIDRLDKAVVRSMEKYNTDRAMQTRKSTFSEEIDIGLQSDKGTSGD